MGVDITGGMIVGEVGLKIKMLEGVKCGYTFSEDYGLDCYPMYYDAPAVRCVYGFSVTDTPLDDSFQAWVEDVKDKAIMFERITGVPARLIGTQCVY